MIGHNIKQIFRTNLLILLSGVVTSLLSARALGPAGRGDLLVIVMWPPVCALLVNLGLPQSHRYWMAKAPEAVSTLYSNAVIFALVVGVMTLALAEFIVPHLVGERSPEVMRLVRIYLVNIPAALALDLMCALLEGAQRFGWSGAARMVFFGVQLAGFSTLWLLSDLTVHSATLTMIASQMGSLIVALYAVRRVLRPHWHPSWAGWKQFASYGVRDYPGVLAEFTTLRLDQLLLGGMASSAAVGLYFIAVRLSEITTTLASSVAEALMPAVAAAEESERLELLLGRSLRLTFYVQAVVVAASWFAAPSLLSLLYGEEFLPATNALRLLLLASLAWSAGSIILSGLNGFGYPGSSALARFAAAGTMTILLFLLLPIWGITGAAAASVAGYSVMFATALFLLARRRNTKAYRYLRPRLDDFPTAHLKSFWNGQALRARDSEV